MGSGQNFTGGEFEMFCSAEVIKYKNKEFCKSINCTQLTKQDECKIKGCIYSAKDFHHWLNKNNFCISKCIKAEI
jgi:hypothetical protein